ncbi:MAG TPA: hypothetical protein VFY58_00080 [Nocardioides sp.]|nr:hypothetical protein [Nocardioides sp.]
MTGKRAKPSPWRFLRVAPVATVVAVVWVMVALFLLSPDRGADQAQDWGIGPVPTEGSVEDTAGPEPRPADSSATTGANRAPRTETASPVTDSRVAPTPAAAPRAAGPPTQREEPGPRPSAPTGDARTPSTTSQSSTQAPTQSQLAAGPTNDNPGKKKGHHDGHGPNDDRP